jgi:hypothetical protein
MTVPIASSDRTRLEAVRRDLFGNQPAENPDDVARWLALAKDPGAGAVPDRD